ncbi:hypothetical protein ANANG_G00185500 [Anguilla anguilla]|uniref:Dimethylargininase n=1 Tax=Anguilla anguilla TaxID=7936 RepID=A0A9D3M7T3_ANGAN|nr:hypothetical protein ANANG_G00185500 [Anguilla anguilla]
MAGVRPYGCFTHAVVRGIPESFGGAAEGGDTNGGCVTELAKAQRQFGMLTGALRQKVGLQLIEIPRPRPPPTAGGWRTWPSSRETRRSSRGHGNSSGAVRWGRRGLRGATLEGSDVLFTGKEFFVGISPHTNHRGAEVLADTFRDFAVSTVPVCGGTRLKNICSMGGPDTIVISNSEGAKKTLRMMEQLTDHHYEVLTVPEDAAANCIYIRGPSKAHFLLHRTADECPDSAPAFQKLTDYTLLPTACTEASKLGGALSSFCLLINRKPQL